ncbi:MAG: hypothetical protein EZS28_034665, partial [Streblomastix strix]
MSKNSLESLIALYGERVNEYRRFRQAGKDEVDRVTAHYSQRAEQLIQQILSQNSLEGYIELIQIRFSEENDRNESIRISNQRSLELENELNLIVKDIKLIDNSFKEENLYDLYDQETFNLSITGQDGLSVGEDLCFGCLQYLGENKRFRSLDGYRITICQRCFEIFGKVKSLQRLRLEDHLHVWENMHFIFQRLEIKKKTLGEVIFTCAQAHYKRPLFGVNSGEGKLIWVNYGAAYLQASELAIFIRDNVNELPSQLIVGVCVEQRLLFHIVEFALFLLRQTVVYIPPKQKDKGWKNFIKAAGIQLILITQQTNDIIGDIGEGIKVINISDHLGSLQSLALESEQDIKELEWIEPNPETMNKEYNPVLIATSGTTSIAEENTKFVPVTEQYYQKGLVSYDPFLPITDIFWLSP